MAGRRWTRQEDADLKCLWDSTKTLEELAAIFPGRSATSIQVRAKRLGLKHSQEQFIAILSKKASGVKNGMWGKAGPRRGALVTPETRERLREKALAGYAKGRRKLLGAENPAFGKPSPTRGRPLPEGARRAMSEKASLRWSQRPTEWQEKHMLKMRHGWAAWVDRRGSTAIERIVENWLRVIGVSYRTEAVVGHYVVDFLVGQDVIEAFGDYWHGNPIKYDQTKLDKTQRSNRGRDRAKETFLRGRGSKLLVLWESDIHLHPQECLQHLAEFLRIGVHTNEDLLSSVPT